MTEKEKDITSGKKTLMMTELVAGCGYGIRHPKPYKAVLEKVRSLPMIVSPIPGMIP